MAVRERLLPWDSQPQEVAQPNAELSVDTLLHPVSGRLVNLAGEAWTHASADYPFLIVNQHGLAASWGGTAFINRYVNRAKPGNGPRTIAILFAPASTNSGVWSIAGTETSGSPFVLLGKNGSDLRLWLGGAYRITLSGVLTVGVPICIVLTFSSLTPSGAVVATLSANGVTGSYSGTHSAATDTYEFLSGFGTYPTGDFNCVWETPVVLADPVQYTFEPKFWAAFAPQSILIPVSAGGGPPPTFIPSWAHRRARTIGAGVI